jgi:hypothetical protein
MIERYSKWADAPWARILLSVGALCLIAPNLWAELVATILVIIAIGYAVAGPFGDGVRGTRRLPVSDDWRPSGRQAMVR